MSKPRADYLGTFPCWHCERPVRIYDACAVAVREIVPNDPEAWMPSPVLCGRQTCVMAFREHVTAEWRKKKEVEIAVNVSERIQ